MSHFTVLVIGGDHEEQLAPYDENLKCDPRREDLDLEGEIVRMLKHYTTDLPKPKSKAGKAIKQAYGDSLPIVVANGVVQRPTMSILRLLYYDWCGRELHKDDKGYYTYTTYNEKSKWDWYTVGGRWTGYFKLKPGHTGEVGEGGWSGGDKAEEGWVDVCTKGDVDVEAMRDAAGSDAGTYWDKVHAVVSQHPGPIETWDAVRTRIAGADAPAITDEAKFLTFKEAVEKARTIYRAQPVIAAVADVLGPFAADDVLVATREAWVQRARNGALSTFAVLKDGEWFEKGHMGWWGMASNEKDVEEWNRQFAELFDTLPDTTPLTLIDAHI